MPDTGESQEGRWLATSFNVEAEDLNCLQDLFDREPKTARNLLTLTTIERGLESMRDNGELRHRHMRGKPMTVLRLRMRRVFRNRIQLIADQHRLLVSDVVREAFARGLRKEPDAA